MAYDHDADRQYEALARRRPAEKDTRCADCGASAIADVLPLRSYCREHYNRRSAHGLLFDLRPINVLEDVA